MSARPPWTHEELQALIPELEREIAQTEAEQKEEVRPLPPMTVEEATQFFYRLMDIAATRPLTQRECFMHGQLLACFQYAVRAETLGKKGRFFVLSEEQINQMVEKKK